MSASSPLWNALDCASKVIAMVQAKMHQSKVCKQIPTKDAELTFCYQSLKKVSRSFAAVIMALDSQVRDAICIFYLVLRGLDTVEDDMSVSLDVKVPELLAFFKRLEQPGWNIHGIGLGDERELLERFDLVITAFGRLQPHLQEPIRDICRRMGEGMADSVQRTQQIQTVEEYEQYCHYVAGLVGHGLTRIFAASGLESPNIAARLDIANSMGLFLQKVNIIRDYLEDIVEDPPRMFWPKEIWGQFTDDFHSFKDAANSVQAVKCLNAMVLNSLKHVPDCMAYMGSLKNPSVFQFCGIPQVMAIATLAELYNNPKVFTGVVKISKGLACQLMMDCSNMSALLQHFRRFMLGIQAQARQVSPGGRIVSKLEELLEANAALIKQEQSRQLAPQSSHSLSFMLLMFCAGLVASAVQTLKTSLFPVEVALGSESLAVAH
eukprot:GGOE01011280.1.p1 GENE.GGOE01011280.1~~GGOE01011280.1.p1  ORF type:complete len:443 (+),score=126.86 GGOE01011280.1:27-1331(+)